MAHVTLPRTEDQRLPETPASTPTASATLILPAFNEELGLAATLADVRRQELDLEVVVVDDGSSDGTAAVAAAADVVLIRHPSNRGKGAALRSGAAAASTDRLVIMDADATYPALALRRMVALLDDHDYVSAVRRTGRTNIPLVNRFGNAAIANTIRVVSGSRLADPLTGMYALRRDAFERLRVGAEGFGLETEIAIKAARAGLRTAQVGIRYGERAGHSKLSPMRDGVAIARTIAQVALDGRFRRGRTAP